MSDQPPSQDMPFLMAKELENFTCGKSIVKLYPRVTPDMPPNERALAFQIAKAGLTNLPEDYHHKVDTIGTALNSSTMCEGITHDYQNLLKERWADIQGGGTLSVVSFHSSSGAVINNTTDPANPSVLLPVQNGPINACRQSDVAFVRIQGSIDFSPLFTMGNPPSTALRVSYYIQLPQTTVAMTNGAGAAYNLTTFHGAQDLSTLSLEQMRTDVLQVCMQEGPILLKPADFNLAEANIDRNGVLKSLHENIHQLMWPQLLDTLFSTLCAGYADQPHVAIDGVKQTYVDKDGTSVTTTVFAYYNQLMIASRPIASCTTMPVSLANKFAEGLDQRLLPAFRRQYADHNVRHALDSTTQRHELGKMLTAAQSAEDEVRSIQKIAQTSVGGGQAFSTSVVSPLAYPSASAGVNASQAERTIQSYDSDGGRSVGTATSSSTLKCFGCGSPHPWQVNGTVTCPNANNPGVRETAAKNYQAFLKRMKQKRKKNMGKRKLDVDNMTDDEKKKLRQALFSTDAPVDGVSDDASAASSITNPTFASAGGNSSTALALRRQSGSRGQGGRGRGGFRGMILVVDVNIFASQSSLKKTLPCPIHPNFPHIILKLGRDINDDNSPSLRVVVDTAAALSVGNWHYHAAIAKQFPGCVHKIYTPEDYSPIVLSGIVQKGEETVTTELGIAIQYHLPYANHDGEDTTFLVATGTHVTANTIVGLPFIQATGMVIDMNDKVAELTHLDVPPSPIEFRRAAVHVPQLEQPSINVNLTQHHKDVIAEIEHLERYVAEVYSAQVSPSAQGRVRFGSAAPPSAASTSAQRGAGTPVINTTTSVMYDMDSLSQVSNTSAAGSGSASPMNSWQRIEESLPAEQARMMNNSNDVDIHDNMVWEGHANQLSNLNQSTTHSAPDRSAPIQVAPKSKRRKRGDNVFFDNRGFPDQSDEFDTLLHNINGGPILRKRKHPAPPIDHIDPAFASTYNEAQHGAKLRDELDLSHLPPEVQAKVTNLIKQYWPVFDDNGLFVPVKDYECVIDTGTARPIAMKKIQYGPRETPIMNKCIAKLEKLGHIRQIHGGRWLFKALLAPKPHQEHVRDIDDFIWRFCVNYIPLNQITCLTAYPIPRCDQAVTLAFGDAKYWWSFDANQGYHQIRVSPESQEKLAFAGPDATKYTYNVMPFGPVNGPITFIMFMHDVDSTWKAEAEKAGITINEDTNTKLIVDDILSWSDLLDKALRYMECQLRVCQSQNLSLSLKKSQIFQKRFEFVGIDVSPDGNRPAMSKHQLLTHWPKPLIVRDIAKFVGFTQFYCKFIPDFELRISSLRDIMKNEYTDDLEPYWNDSAQQQFDAMKKAVLDDPVLKRFDHRKLLVLCTDFASDGFGYAACQPGDDKDSLAAMDRAMKGGSFDFLTKESKAVLHPVAFGARRTRGNEARLHSYLGEAFSGDWAINKCRHMTFGQRFIWVTDCYAVRFILSYDGRNPAVLRVQMRLMCWDMEIHHRNGDWLTDADYWSRLGADLCFDPLLREYIQRAQSRRVSHPAPTQLPMQPQNMPYYRGPRVVEPSTNANRPPQVDQAAQAVINSIIVNDCNGFTSLSNVPVRFGELDTPSSSSSRVLYNSDIPLAARQLSSFDWAVYSFNDGHFISSIRSRNLPFRITLCADPYATGRALFKEFTSSKTILSGAVELLNYIRSCGLTSALHGYIIHSPRYASTEPTKKFWQIQASIVKQLRLIRSLSTVMAFVHPDNDKSAVKSFVSSLTRDGWIVSNTSISFPSFGDSVAGSTKLIIGVHSNTEATVTPLELKNPPAVAPTPIAKYLWAPFNTPTSAISYAKDDPLFNKDESSFNVNLKLIVSTLKPSLASANDPSVSIKYHLHREDMDQSILAGAAVYSIDHLCPTFQPASNDNLFQHYFGIEFKHDEHVYVRGISPFEFVSCFGLSNDLTYRLSHPSNQFSMDAAIPSKTSMWIFDQVYERALQIRDANCEIFDPSLHAAPAATIQSFLAGAIGVKLPTHDRWLEAIEKDDELRIIRNLVNNPSLIDKEMLSKVNYNYHSPLRKSQIVLDNGLLIFKEPLDGYTSYTRLQLVPKEFYNILFVAFHSNPIGGHFNAYRTLHRLRLRYYWPGMYSYIKRMCAACPGCALSNPTKQKSSELLYNFPIEAPMKVLHVDGYTVGKHQGFEGSETYLVACCGMCTFAAMEPIIGNPSSTSFASAIMKIQLRYGLPHTVVIDKDSKFFGVCSEALDLLHINRHVLSGDNHNPMLVERINRYLNKGLKIMCNERDSVRIALEAILLLLYAWNSCPVPGTDISRSLVAVGREFSFPIDYSSGKHWELTSSPATVQTYSKELATRLSACEEVAKLMVNEQRAWHREYVNANRPNPRVYNVGDIVFARRATKSDKRRGKVGKIMYPYTGPWKIVSSLSGASYEIEHCISNKKDKKHASDLSPYPDQLVPFQPLDGADNQYSQLYKPIGKDPFKEAGIKGFIPNEPFKVHATLLQVVTDKDFYWPSLAELNDELSPYPFDNEEERRLAESGAFEKESLPILYTGPPPSPPDTNTTRSNPQLNTLIAGIISSTDRLFFISISIGGDAREWRLVRIAFDDSVAMYPSCLQDGRFLVDFYIVHNADTRYNAINQRYWLQYHTMGDIVSPSHSSENHLIRPSDTSAALAQRHNLVPFRKWINITHQDTYIHGPFEFATIRGRKTRDRIAQDDWDILVSHKSMFQNNVPSFDLPTYSIHVDRGVHHVCQCTSSVVSQLQSATNNTPTTLSSLYR